MSSNSPITTHALQTLTDNADITVIGGLISIVFHWLTMNNKYLTNDVIWSQVQESSCINYKPLEESQELYCRPFSKCQLNATSSSTHITSIEPLRRAKVYLVMLKHVAYIECVGVFKFSKITNQWPQYNEYYRITLSPTQIHSIESIEL